MMVFMMLFMIIIVFMMVNVNSAWLVVVNDCFLLMVNFLVVTSLGFGLEIRPEKCFTESF